MLARLAILAVLVLLGLFVLLRVETFQLGPDGEAAESLAVSSAYFDPASSTLYLLTKTRWARVDIAAIREIEAKAKEARPIAGNFLFRQSFHEGNPDADLASLKPVAIYPNTPLLSHDDEGRPRLSPEELAKVPESFEYVFHRAPAESLIDQHYWTLCYFAKVHEDNGERYEARFFYQWDFSRRIARGGREIVLLMPCYLAIVLASLPLLFPRITMGGAIFLYVFAGTIFVGMGGLLILVAGSAGSWGSSGGSGGGEPLGYLLCAFVVIGFLASIRMAVGFDAKDAKRRGDPRDILHRHDEEY